MTKRKSYAQKNYPVFEAQRQFIASLTEGQHQDNYRFLCHILISTLIKGYRDYWVPASYPFRAEHFPGLDLPYLLARGYVEQTGYSPVAHKCRRFSVTPHILERFSDLSPIYSTDLPEALALPRVNLLTGKPVRGKLTSQELSEKTRLSRAGDPIVSVAIERLNTCYFNAEATQRHLRRTRAAYIALPQGSPEREKAVRRHTNDASAIGWITGPQPTSQFGVYSFATNYQPTRTGRITSRTQSLSRAMKAQFYSGIELDGRKLLNLDLESSQPTILAQLFRETGIACPWLDEYLADRSLRERYAKDLGISVKTFKKILYVVMMCGSLPNVVLPPHADLRNPDFKRSLNSTALALHEEISDRSLLPEIYSKFADLTKPLRKSRDAFLKYMRTEYPKLHPEALSRAGKLRYFKNAVGCPVAFSGEAVSILKRSMMASLLQGKESLFIHTLTTLADEYGFEPIGNEADGLIVLCNDRSKLDEAIERAKFLANMPDNTRLSEKPFDDPDKAEYSPGEELGDFETDDSDPDDVINDIAA